MTTLAKILGMALATAAAFSWAFAEEPPTPTDDVQVMIIGSFHFRPSTQDVISTQADDMRSPARQAELEALAASLAEFAPTVIAVEDVAAAPDYAVDYYADFGPAVLRENVSEQVQIGCRLARRMGLETVHGIDEKPGEGEPDYFPFDAVMAHVAEIGREDEFQAMIAEMRTRVEAEQERLNALPIGQALHETNTGLIARPEFYYRLLEFDQGEAQPGSELNGLWFTRNAKIFAKLQDVTTPGDRVVVVFGAGHAYWLNHLVAQTPGYVSVDPSPYLLAATQKD